MPNRSGITRKYERLVRRLEKRAQAHATRLSWLSLGRVCGFGLLVALPLLVGRWLDDQAGVWPAILLGLVAFGAALVLYEKRRAALERTRRHISATQDLLLRTSPENLGRLSRTGGDAADPAHPFAGDLQVFGELSLFRLLDRTVTGRGTESLREWLLELAPTAAVIRARRRAVLELSARSVLRSRLQRTGRGLGGPADEARADLQQFLDGRAVPGLGLWIWPARLLPALTVTGYVAFSLELTEAYHYLTFPLQVLVFLAFNLIARVQQASAVRIADSLRETEALLGAVESFRPRAGLLAELEILRPDRKVYGTLRSLSRSAGLLATRRNPLAHALLGVFLLYDVHLCHALERLRNRTSGRLEDWLSELGRLDALVSVADANALHPDWCAAEVTDPEPRGRPSDPPLLEGIAVRHPLISGDAAVGNDLRLDPAVPIWLVSGSNMAGKSTLLRSIGACVVLARLGCAVPADRLAFVAGGLFTSMNVADDLSRSTSLFFAEVRRIRALLETAAEAPTLFLVDEILRGTNERERHVAVRYVLHELRTRGAWGLAATHDLALLRDFAGESGFRAVHFREDVDSAGRMTFDYRLRPGPVTSSNALRLLRAEGIAVPDEG